MNIVLSQSILKLMEFLIAGVFLIFMNKMVWLREGTCILLSWAYSFSSRITSHKILGWCFCNWCPSYKSFTLALFYIILLHLKLFSLKNLNIVCSKPLVVLDILLLVHIIKKTTIQIYFLSFPRIESQSSWLSVYWLGH